MKVATILNNVPELQWTASQNTHYIPQQINTGHKQETKIKYNSITLAIRSLQKGRIRTGERQFLDPPRVPSQFHPSKIVKDGTLTETVRASMLRRGYDILPEKVGFLQLRRRGYSESKQFLPLQISVPPTSTLCDIEGRFENPRKAPLPQGLKYNTMQTAIPQSSTSSDCLSTPRTIGMTLLCYC